MEIVKLEPGEEAPKDSDCIRIDALPDGAFRLVGSALLACGDSDQAESVSLIGGQSYADCDQAIEAGMAWASGHCVETLYIETAQAD
jgi:hypothetical protein